MTAAPPALSYWHPTATLAAPKTSKRTALSFKLQPSAYVVHLILSGPLRSRDLFTCISQLNASFRSWSTGRRLHRAMSLGEYIAPLRYVNDAEREVIPDEYWYT